jgi:myosin-3
MYVVTRCFQVRSELQAEIIRQRAEGRSHRQPDVTTKHGKLKPHRKSKPQPMYLDDLAALDILSEVCSESLCR